MYTSIMFLENDSKQKIGFSELVNEKEMFISGEMWSECYTKPFKIAFTITEKEMRELRRHLTRQIRKLQLNK